MIFAVVCNQEQLLTFASQGPLTGVIGDTYGPRIPILIGTFLHVFGLMMTSISHEFYQFFLAQSIVSAMGCSFLFFPSTYHLTSLCLFSIYREQIRNSLETLYHNTNTHSSTRSSRPILHHASRPCPRYRRLWLLHRWHNTPHHGRAPNPTDQLRLGYAQRRIPPARPARHW
jgi:hypothetical protein